MKHPIYYLLITLLLTFGFNAPAFAYLPPGSLVPIPSTLWGSHWVNNPTGSLGVGFPVYGFPQNVAFDDFGQGTMRLWDTLVTWKMIETSPGVYDFSRLDAQLDTLKAAGKKIVYVAGQTPDFYAMTPNPGNITLGPSPPTDVDTGDNYFKTYLTATVQHIAARYPGGLLAVEVWNEVDLSTYWSGTTAQMVTISTDAAAIVRANSGAKALTASISNVQTSGLSYWASYLPLLSQTNFDGLAVHPYNGTTPPEGLFVSIPQLIGIRNGAGFTGSPLYFTEYTYTSYRINNVVYTTPSEPMDDDRGTSYLERMFFCAVLSGAINVNFYGQNYSASAIRQLDIVTPTIQLKPAAGMEYITGLVSGIGNHIVQGIPQGGGINTLLHEATITTKSGRGGLVLWTEDDWLDGATHSVTVDLSGYRTVTDDIGTPIVPSSSVAITMSPIFALD